MEWDTKMPPWSPEELGHAAELSTGPVVVCSSSSGLLCHSGGLDCSVDLNLGGLGDIGSSNKWNEGRPTAPMAMESPPGPSKRPRAPANGSHSASCLVDGCEADLTKCREYHRRHKVCEAHSKTPVVTICGQKQRFCQQCSRFHSLEEFDDGKRSCRTRLDGHNRRRRKPQPSSVTSGGFIPDHQGTLFSAYSQMFATAALDSNWNRNVKTEDNTLYSPHSIQNVSNTYSFSRERKQFPFLQDNETAICSKSTSPTSLSQLNFSTTIPSRGIGSRKMFVDGLTQVFDSDCALSLLSSPMPSSSHINLSHLVPPADGIPMGHPLVSSLRYGYPATSQVCSSVTPTGFSYAGMMDRNTGTVLVSDHPSENAEISSQNIFHDEDEGSLEEPRPTLHFSWPQLGPV
ncbi:hypothetical protein Cni_G27521 [Canna indica]|uniref:SBP-type domain-containing protein n=1 Tax=Canna indica TaxID=4628 RepID=A0AAQ3L1A6_9LILI|nr:hypothetical protein Cni_G27521 [Canna indica]